MHIGFVGAVATFGHGVDNNLSIENVWTSTLIRRVA